MGDCEITGCTIVGNTTLDCGGGLAFESWEEATISNNTIAGNVAGYYGAGVIGYGCDPTLKNCTITENRAYVYYGGWEPTPAEGAGVMFWNCPNATLIDCILWDNMAKSGPNGFLYRSTVTMQYSDVEGGQDSFKLSQGTLAWGEGNLDVDPLFVYPATGEFYLSPGSPCLDAGDPASDFSLEPEPDGGRVNMGAYGNTPEATSKAGLGITGYGLISRTRVGRTVFAYELTVTVHNGGDSAVSDVVLTLLNMPDNVTIGGEPGEDTVDIGPVAAGATVTSVDTFKIIVDRTVPVSSLAISWAVAYTVDGESGEFIFTAPLSGDDLDGEPAPGDDDGFDVDERFEEIGKRPTGVRVEESSGSGGRRAIKQSRPASSGKTRTL